MQVVCPALPPLETLPFAHDRDAAWHMLLASGKVAVSDAGVYFISGADVVEEAATNPGLFSSQGAFDLIGSPFPMVPIAFDPPEHTRFRRVLDKFFGPRRMAERAPELRQQVGELIDQITTSGGSCELVSALAIPFPCQVFLTLFGLPLADRDLLIGWKDAVLEFSIAAGSPPSPETLARGSELVAYLTGHLADRRGSDGDDLLSQLLSDSTDSALTEVEIIGLCFLFLVAGLDTVTAAPGFALYELAHNPALRSRVTDDEKAVAHFIEEVLRINPPIPYVPSGCHRRGRCRGCDDPRGISMLAWVWDRQPRPATIPRCRRHPPKTAQSLRIRPRSTSLPGFTPGSPGTAPHHRGMEPADPYLLGAARGHGWVAERDAPLPRAALADWLIRSNRRDRGGFRSSAAPRFGNSRILRKNARRPRSGGLEVPERRS